MEIQDSISALTKGNSGTQFEAMSGLLDMLHQDLLLKSAILADIHETDSSTERFLSNQRSLWLHAPFIDDGLYSELKEKVIAFEN